MGMGAVTNRGDGRAAGEGRDEHRGGQHFLIQLSGCFPNVARLGGGGMAPWRFVAG